MDRLARWVTGSQAWRSIFRHGYPATNKNRSLAVYGNVFLHLQPVKVRVHAVKVNYTYCLGGISFFLFLLLTITGVYLMFFYAPVIPRAYTDILAIQALVPFGLLMRNMHRWSAHLMVLAVVLHMMRVFYTGSYKPPREFNWVVGVVLLVITFLLSFTGYLLPWDQIAIWAVTVGTNMARYAPIVGPQTRALLLGSQDVGGDALLRFYVLHVIALPLVAAVFMAVHFWRIRKDGGISGPL